MNLNPTSCVSQNQFDKICGSFEEINTKGVKLVIVQDENGNYYPIHNKTNSKNYLRCSDEFLIKFFEANQKWAVNQRSCIKKVVLNRTQKPKDEKITNRLNCFLNELKVRKEKQKELAIRKCVVAEEKSRWEKYEKKKKQELEHIEKQEIYVKQQISHLKGQICELKTDKNEMKDLLILCSNGKKIVVHSQQFNSLPFLLQRINNNHEEAKKHLSQEEIACYPNIKKILDFTSYSDEAIALALSYLERNQTFKKNANPRILIETYDLANSVQYLSLKKDCVSQLKYTINKRQILSILCEKDYDIYDKLIQFACKYIARNSSIIFDSQFYKVKEKYLIELIRHKQIYEKTQQHLQSVSLQVQKETKDLPIFKFEVMKNGISAKISWQIPNVSFCNKYTSPVFSLKGHEFVVKFLKSERAGYENDVWIGVSRHVLSSCAYKFHFVIGSHITAQSHCTKDSATGRGKRFKRENLIKWGNASNDTIRVQCFFAIVEETL